MNERTKRINKAIQMAKRRDNFRCLLTGTEYNLQGAHILPRNIGLPRYDPADSANIMTLAVHVHANYDRNHSWKDKVNWLEQKGLIQFAQRIRWIYGELDHPESNEHVVLEGLALK